MIDVNIVYEVDRRADIEDNSFNKICEDVFNDKNHEQANITLILSGDEKLRELKNAFFQQDVFILCRGIIIINIKTKLFIIRSR